MMKRIGWMWVGVLAAAWLAGCGSSGSGGEDTVTLSGRLMSSPVAARVAAAGGAYYVEAVDESGTTQDIELGVTERFQLQVPVDHDYVLVVGDDAGPIGGMRYGAPGQERSEFRVRASMDLGDLVVDRENRSVRGAEDAALEPPDHVDRPDNDDDGIPDHADDDDDNDGIVDSRDRVGNQDTSMDHDNDGMADDLDDDDDNDGIVDDDDHTGEMDHSRDRDNDGMADDRDGGDVAAGAVAYAALGCVSCHGEDGSGTVDYSESIRGESAAEVAETMLNGEGGDDADHDDDDDDDDGDDDGDEYMPSYPADVVAAAAADIAAFLNHDGPIEDAAGSADADGDGVVDRMDQCMGTPAGTQVGLDGCPVDLGGGTPADADMDGVADAVDQCAGTPAGAVVDANGCADTDGDGVFDSLDQCAGTAAAAQVDAAGCVVVTNPGPDGAQLFTDNCALCHGGSLGNGGKMDLTRNSQIAKIRNKISGGHQGVSFTSAEFEALETYLTNWMP